MNSEMILQDYYADDARRLHGMVDGILSKFGGIYQKDRDDFYSIANEVLAKVCLSYDQSQNFDSYVYSCLSNRIKTEMTRLNREKRKADRLAISIETPLGSDEGTTVGDVLVSDFDLEREMEERYSDSRVLSYLEGLSKVQRRIVEMKMEDVTASEIKKELKLTDKQYEGHCGQIRSFGRIRMLFGEQDQGVAGEESRNCSSQKKEETMSEMISQTSEKSKQKSYSISAIIRKMDSYTFRFDHPAQREAEQWSPKMKGNLISDILQDNPIPALVFAEQIVDGMVITWNLDGKQKCTNVYEFFKDGFRISRNVRRWLIRYQAVVRDQKGRIVLSENEVPQFEWKECDIRGKKYSELPMELQEQFHDYTFEVTQYLNCSSDDISYHIARYNEGKPMTQSQKGMAYLGEEFASMVKSIASMDFFKDQGGYKVSEFRNGTMNRVVVESIMASNFLKDWKKQQEEMCDFIRENAATGDFERFEEMVERLSVVVTDEVSEMFDSKDSFLWFGLFARFEKLGLEDERFIEFMSAFGKELHGKVIHKVSFDDLNGKSTKDKNVVIGKMRHLEWLMTDFLQGVS